MMEERKLKFRLQIVEETSENEFTVLSSGIAELGVLKLQEDFGINPFLMMAEQLLKEVEEK